VIVDDAGREIAQGYSRNDDPHVHAEQIELPEFAPLAQAVNAHLGRQQQRRRRDYA
jgi:hypothetical protein